MYLAYGYFGDGVRQLQRDLNLACYEAGEVDGIFGVDTQAAVIRLQSHNGLVVDGIYGAQSDSALVTEIKDIQSRLKAIGYDIAIDGMAGPKTEGAVRDFQDKHGLAVDGIVGKETLGQLKQEIPKKPVEANKSSLRGKKIYICAGHGGSDPGAVGHGFTEAERTLSATFMLGKMLQDQGAEVMLGRTGDYYLSLASRAAASDAFKADIYISWHFNGFSPQAHGCETWYKSVPGGRLAGPIQEELIKATGLRDRGIKRTDDLYELNVPDAVCVLLEPLFITNGEDIVHLSDAGLFGMADAVCRGVVRYFN